MLEHALGRELQASPYFAWRRGLVTQNGLVCVGTAGDGSPWFAAWHTEIRRDGTLAGPLPHAPVPTRRRVMEAVIDVRVPSTVGILLEMLRHAVAAHPALSSLSIVPGVCVSYVCVTAEGRSAERCHYPGVAEALRAAWHALDTL